MNIGLVVAIETDSIFAHYKERTELECPVGYNLFLVKKGDNNIYILHTGMGEIAASAGVQFLISKYDVSLIVNFGVVGGLIPDMSKRKVCVVERVVHYKYDCSEFMDLAIGQVDGHDSIFLPTTHELVTEAVRIQPDLFTATCCSGDKFISTESEKNYLHDAFEGNICDMESAGIVLACEMNGIPCLLLKAVSDGLCGGAKEFYEELGEAAMCCLVVADKVIDYLLKK